MAVVAPALRPPANWRFSSSSRSRTPGRPPWAAPRRARSGGLEALSTTITSSGGRSWARTDATQRSVVAPPSQVTTTAAVRTGPQSQPTRGAGASGACTPRRSARTRARCAACRSGEKRASTWLRAARPRPSAKPGAPSRRPDDRLDAVERQVPPVEEDAAGRRARRERRQELGFHTQVPHRQPLTRRAERGQVPRVCSGIGQHQIRGAEARPVEPGKRARAKPAGGDETPVVGERLRQADERREHEPGPRPAEAPAEA